MSEAKHTPGPWKTQTHISLDRLEIRDADGRRIAECAMDFPMSAKTHDANAHLIAAAPEMLDELEKQRNKHCFASSGVGDCDTCRDKQNCSLRRVINKAKGVHG